MHGFKRALWVSCYHRIYVGGNHIKKKKKNRRNETKEEPIVSIDGKITFWGAVVKYWPSLSTYWNTLTQKTYQGDYYEILAPYFKEKSLAEYNDAEYFEHVINLIREKGMRRSSKKKEYYSESTLQHFRYLLTRLMRYASEGEGFINPLLGTTFGDTTVPPTIEVAARLRTSLQKSFSSKQEYQIADEIFTDPLEPGELIGLLLMWVFGWRNKESCGFLWGDIQPLPEHPGLYMLVLHMSNIKDSRDTHSKGKTRNMYRIWVIPPLVYDFLMTRKAHIQSLIDSGEITFTEKIKSIDHMPIVCKGHNWLVRCKASELSAAGQSLFRKIKLTDEQQQYFSAKPDSSDKLGSMAWDKDPTTYSLRRNVATHLYILLGGDESSLGGDEILPKVQYLLGHEILESGQHRHDYSNPSLQFELYEKLKQRPIVNNIQFEAEPIEIREDVRLKDVTRQQAKITGRNRKVRVRVIPYAPHEPCNISLKAIPFGDTLTPIEVTYKQVESDARIPASVYMIGKYHEMYYREFKRHEQSKASATQKLHTDSDGIDEENHSL